MFGKNLQLEDVQPFPEIPDDYFDIKDETVIKDLLQLAQNHTETMPVNNGQISQEFRQKQKFLLTIFDNIDSQYTNKYEKPDLYNPIDADINSIQCPYQQFDFYDLSNIIYDQKEAVLEANKFLSQNNKNTIEYKFEKMQIEPKNETHKNYNKLTKKMELLSFQEYEQNEY